MTDSERIAILGQALLCSLGLMIFSFFIHYPLPVRLLSFAALLASAFIISSKLRSLNDLKLIIGESFPLVKMLLYILIGILAGLLLALLYRSHLGMRLFPGVFGIFVIPAAMIGCMEELVFRGFLQEYVRKIAGPVSVIFSTIAHTGYKCCLFLAPVVTASIDIGFLAIWTFAIGLLFGTIRYYTKNLLPAISAHVLFDILVYAEYVNSPWWVW